MGAEVVPGRGVHFRVWAPDHERVTLVLEDDGAGGAGRELPLEPGAEGYHAVLAREAARSRGPRDLRAVPPRLLGAQPPRGGLALHRDLLALRRQDPAFAAQQPNGLDGAVLAPDAFVLRFFGPGGHDGDRLLIVNLGRDLPLHVAPEPLLAPPAGMRWDVIWSSEAPRYDGAGTPEVVTEEGLRLPGEAVVVLGGRRQ